jgi:putative nucleotidyltransferase with HDIG domain
MFTREGPVGAIQVLNKPTPYTEFDQELLSYLAGHAAVSLERARFHEDQRNFQIHITDILLDAIDRFIPEKRGHSRRVAQYANMLAKALGLQEAERRRLYFASLLHDIGFMRIPLEEHFQKSQYMKHPVIGYEMLSPISFYKDIATVVLHHHERYDGYGYPQGLKGEQIPLQSRIIHIAEAFDSMVSRVSYKIAVSFDVAMEELLRHAGSQFDPALVGRFREVVEKPLE